jgi:hypothetical protein
LKSKKTRTALAAEKAAAAKTRKECSEKEGAMDTLHEGRQIDDVLEVWFAGCHSGESEAYVVLVGC